MSQFEAIYLVVSGSSSARCVPDLLKGLTEFELPVYTILTDNAHQVLSPYNLADQAGHILLDSYFDPVLLHNRPPGLTLVAPATFNTLNKISRGIADTLAHSLVAEAIGAGWPVIIAPSMNPALANHPQVADSLAILKKWGVTVLESHAEKELLVMASEKEIIDVVKTRLSSGSTGNEKNTDH